MRWLSWTVLILIFASFGLKTLSVTRYNIDWLQSLKQFFINVSYHILVASLTLMALLKTEPSELD